MRETRVLLVNEKFTLRQNLSDLLASHQAFTVLSSTSSEVLAFQKVQQHETDVLLLNVQQSFSEEVQFLEKIQKAHPDLPILILGEATVLSFWALIK